ncbi:hypothetical protein J6TS2_08410 [Heyndrickxia sporothermodurans]|nr:hypothetical protein J6TS2_08410 [Heyndrickxia sporothermodurans]
MKTIVNYPYVYFFLEPNVVFVYKIETDFYLTLETFIHHGEWQTFEIEDENDFDSFHHQQNEALQGRSYLINEEDRNQMLQMINKLIQIQRQSLTQNKVEPVHIVCSEAAAGCLRVGLDYPKTVIGVDGMFSIGPIWRLEHKEGIVFRNEWLNDRINFGNDDYTFENNFANALLEIEDIFGSAPIHIWFANNADEQIGLRFILYLLKNKQNDIFLFNTSELYTSFYRQELENHMYTAEIYPEKIRMMYKEHKGTPLTEKERVHFEREWEALSQSKDVLHIYQKNDIMSIPEPYYDSMIIDTIKQMHAQQKVKDYILTAELIGDLLQSYPSANILFLEYRIRELVYAGVLELKGVPKSMRHYRVKIKTN